jgi:single-stranded DNA-binding protein
MNYAIFTGNLLRDAEIKTSKDGSSTFGTLSIMVSSGFGNNKYEFPVSGIQNNPSANLYNFLKKGKKISIKGNVKPNSYKSQDGSVVAEIKVSIDNIELLGGEGGSGNYQNGSAKNAAPAPEQYAQIPRAVPAPRQQAMPQNDTPFSNPQAPASPRQKILEKAKMAQDAGLVDTDDLPF